MPTRAEAGTRRIFHTLVAMFFSSCERDDAVKGEDLAENIFFFPTHHFRPVKATRQHLG